MQDYNFVIKHILGESNKSDALSRRPDYNKGGDDNVSITVLPPELSYSPPLSPASSHEPEHCQPLTNVSVATNKPSKTYLTSGRLLTHSPRLTASTGMEID